MSGHMKVRAIKVLIFSTALLLGLIAAWVVGFSLDHTPTVELPIAPPVEVPFVVAPTNRQQVFRPEFFDLQNFEEDLPSPPDGHLIEMFEGGIYRRSETYASNGQQWLIL